MFAPFPSRTVAFTLFHFDVHWYGVLYFVAFMIAWKLLPRLQKKRDLTLWKEDWESILAAAVIGVVVGGRLGYVLFYAPFYYFYHPLEILAVWHGGMASHGGFIGVALTVLWTCRWRKIDDVLRIGDIAVIPAAIGLGIGRIGNFINQELYGTVTTLPWGMSFPGAVGLRHPIQFYDFIVELCIAFLLYLHLSKRPIRPGRTLALFLILYGIARFFLEFIREQFDAYFIVGPIVLSEGQLLTIPVLVIGIWLWYWAGRRVEKQQISDEEKIRQRLVAEDRQ